MSVIVQGMDMPKSCIECVINHSFFRVLKCSQLKGMKGFKKLPHENDRHPDCPLIALPEKHSRLIDEDDVIDAIVEYGQNDDKFKWGDIIKYTPSEIQKIIKEFAPTIIEMKK